MDLVKLHLPIRRQFRLRRMKDFARQFSVTADTRILDVGGDHYNWALLPSPPRLTILNLTPPGSPPPFSASWIVGNGCRLPFADNSFDIVYSNSVIEHLGTYDNQVRFAREISRVGRAYYVQTPNRLFPIEPHLTTPFIHFLPRHWQLRLFRNWTVWGLLERPGKAECEAMLNELRLLDDREFRSLFPGALIKTERLFGLTKSMMAIHPS